MKFKHHKVKKSIVKGVISLADIFVCPTLTDVQQVVLRTLQHTENIYAKRKTIDHTARFSQKAL